jgi:hypothetical protein
MQGDQPIDDGFHIRLSFSDFPHLVGPQKVFYQAWWDYLLQQSHINLVANLVLQFIFRYANDHEACPFFQDFVDGSSMPSGLPLCLVSFLSSYLLLMSYSYLNSIGVSPQNLFSLFYWPPPAARGEKEMHWGHPKPRQGGFAPCTPQKNLPLKGIVSGDTRPPAKDFVLCTPVFPAFRVNAKALVSLVFDLEQP